MTTRRKHCDSCLFKISIFHESFEEIGKFYIRNCSEENLFKLINIKRTGGIIELGSVPLPIKQLAREETFWERHLGCDSSMENEENVRGPLAISETVQFSFFLKLLARGRIYFYKLSAGSNRLCPLGFNCKGRPRVNKRLLFSAQCGPEARLSRGPKSEPIVCCVSLCCEKWKFVRGDQWSSVARRGIFCLHLKYY